MKYEHFPVPTSIVRSCRSTIVTYESNMFLAREAPWREVVLANEPESSRQRPLLLTFCTAALLVAAYLLGIAAAKADPATLGNQATILRFTNRVTYGAVRRDEARSTTNSALAHFLAVHNRNVFKAPEWLATTGNVGRTRTIDQIKSTGRHSRP